MIKYLANALIGGDGQIEKRNMSWNMIGSFLYALASMVLTIAVIQIVGEDEGGCGIEAEGDLWSQRHQ